MSAVMSKILAAGRRPFLLGLAVYLGGCATLSSMQGARTVEPGRTRVGVHGSLQGGMIPGLEKLLPEDVPPVPPPLPQVEIEVRNGLRERWDWGARLFLLGVAGDVKFQFLDGERWAGAFAPGASIVHLPGIPDLFYLNDQVTHSASELDIFLPVLFERPVGTSSSLVFGPKILARHYWYTLDAPEFVGRSRRFLYDVGGTAVFHWRRTKKWSFPLEVSVFRDLTESTGWSYSLGLGIAIQDGRRDVVHPAEGDAEH